MWFVAVFPFWWHSQWKCVKGLCIWDRWKVWLISAGLTRSTFWITKTWAHLQMQGSRMSCFLFYEVANTSLVSPYQWSESPNHGPHIYKWASVGCYTEPSSKSQLVPRQHHISSMFDLWLSCFSNWLLSNNSFCTWLFWLTYNKLI